MRTALLIGFVLLGTASAFAAEEPSGCDKFKWPIERERTALTAPDRIKLSSGGELATPPATGITLALLPPADAKLNRPDDVAQAVLFALNQPSGCEVRELVVCQEYEGSWP